MNRVPARVAARFESGSAAARLLAPALEVFLPNRTATVVVRSGAAAGIRLPIDPRREKFYWTGSHELSVQRVLERVIAQGDYFWDVGAHIGYFTLIASRLVGEPGRVDAFEPLAENRERMHVAIELNAARNVHVHGVALAARRGPSTFVSGASSLTGSLARRPSQSGVAVETSTLDDEAGRLGLPDLVKIDAEGFEVDVLRGGLRLLNEHGPRVVVEFMNSEQLADARALLPLYEFQPLDERHWLLEVRR